MCGRITTTQTTPEVLQTSFSLPEKPSDDIPPRYNVAPGQDILVVAHYEHNQNKLGWMRWGLIPSWSKDKKIAYKLINARGESVHEKSSFRSAFKNRRCLIVADGYYEWHKNEDGSKTPMYIRLESGLPFGLAGLWERWTDPDSGEILTTCTVVTTTPNDLMATIHTRMPVILPREDYSTWLSREMEDTDELRHLLIPFTAENMIAYPVSTLVNKATNDSPELIEKAG